MKGQEKERKWRISDIGRAIVNSVVAIAKGQFILRLKIDKYFLQVAWTFFLFAMLILFGLGVDVTLSKVEAGKKELQELEILHTQKRYELITLGRRSTVARLLKENGSEVTEPQKPASTLQ
ncbi:MAG: hypothetical protein IJ654_00015 [Bacteroidales bacterium]|nr:hypothetical protein [Bacteroidales bacterium]